MVDPAAPASVRVRAADSIFNHAAKAIEIEDIEARVSELERAPEASKNSTADSVNHEYALASQPPKAS